MLVNNRSYFESLRIFGTLRPEVEARQQYAQWRCRHFSHLIENIVHDNLSERISVHDVYELIQVTHSLKRAPQED